MINIIDSRDSRTTSTGQDLINDLADVLTTKWPSITVVHDTDTPSNVTQIWLSEDVYIELASSGAFLYKHDTLGISTERNHMSNSSCYLIVETDNAVMIHEYDQGNWNYSTAIGTTYNPSDNTESYGAAVQPSNNNLVAYTDGMYSNSVTSLNQSFSSAPQHNEQFVPFTAWNTKDIFPHVYLVTARKSTTRGKILQNGADYFYVANMLAIKYTV